MFLGPKVCCRLRRFRPRRHAAFSSPNVFPNVVFNLGVDLFFVGDGAPTTVFFIVVVGRPDQDPALVRGDDMVDDFGNQYRDWRRGVVAFDYVDVVVLVGLVVIIVGVFSQLDDLRFDEGPESIVARVAIQGGSLSKDDVVGVGTLCDVGHVGHVATAR